MWDDLDFRYNNPDLFPPPKIDIYDIPKSPEEELCFRDLLLYWRIYNGKTSIDKETFWLGVTGAVATRGTQMQETKLMSSIAKRRYKTWVEIPDNVKCSPKEDFVQYVEDEILSKLSPSDNQFSFGSVG